ncbi:MAG: hypothetical protein J6Z12_01715 [Paludibacteraceae bacterium]|nr:hypothetical protein [Paludibacteraceae bacterium]
MKKIVKLLLGVTLTLGVLLVLPFATLRVVTLPGVSNRLLAKYLPEYLQAEARVGRIDYRLLATWPVVELDVDSLLILSTVLEPTDTLLFVPHLRAVADAGTFLHDGQICVHEALLESPYVNGVVVDSLANWDVLPPSEPDTTDEPTEIPPIYVREACIRKARLAYTATDTLSTQTIRIPSLTLNADGAWLPDSIYASAVLDMDSLRYRDPAIERDYRVNGFRLQAKALMADSLIDAHAEALSEDVVLDDRLLDLKHHTLQLSAEAATRPDFKQLTVRRLHAALDDITLDLNGFLQVCPDSSYYTDAQAELNIPRVRELLKLTPKPYSHYLKEAECDGRIRLQAQAKGCYKGKCYPVLDARLNVENLSARYDRKSQPIDRLDLNVNARYNQRRIDSSHVHLDHLFFKSGPSHLQGSGLVEYRNKRQYMETRLLGHLDVGALSHLYPMGDSTVIAGILDPDIRLWMFWDDWKNHRLDRIYTQSVIKGDDMKVVMPAVRLNLWVDSLTARLNTNTASVSRRNQSDTALVNVRVRFDAMDLAYQENLHVSTQRFSIGFMADDILPGKTPKLRISTSARGMSAQLSDTTMRASRLRASLSVMPHPDRPFLPRTSVRLSADSVLAKAGVLSTFLDSARIQLATTPNYHKRAKNAEGKRVVIPDSLQPNVDFKALVDTFIRVSQAEQKVETFMRRFRSEGKIHTRKLTLRSGEFPLRASARDVDINFTDDTLRLDNFRLNIGHSSVVLKGEVANMRRWMLPARRRNANLDRTLYATLNLTSNYIDTNQLLRALYTMNENEKEHPAQATVEWNEADDISQELDSTVQSSLIVIPDRLDLKFNANVKQIRVAKLDLEDFKGEVTLKDNTIRIKQLSTSTDLGDAAANVMYHCPGPEKANAAVTLDMDSIQIGKLVTALPALDTIMPMLRSFKGSVFCEASATCDIDSSMNIVLPSVNAGAYLQGRNLVLLDGETFSEIAKMLMFNKKTENLIDSISVELMVENNEIQIFPFMLSMDKYRVGVGGRQNLDMSFNYHIAVLKSPLLIRLGIDVFGTDFDHIKFRLSSPKFKDSNVKIGRGGTLLRQEDANIRDNFQKMVEKSILME